jgi:hypothetical protein
MRLRQVALIAREIEPVAQQLGEVFDLKVGFRDPGVEVFGLTNVVMPVGGEFLEVVSPFREDASGARYLARRGGDAGYMVILQDEDAFAHRDRLEAMGVRLIAKSPRGSTSDWPPAGPAWREHESGQSVGIAAVTIQARDPVGACERWCELLDASARTGGDTLEIPLERGLIRFTPPVDSDGTGVVALDIEVRDAEATLQRARSAGLPVAGGAAQICGVALRPIEV